VGFWRSIQTGMKLKVEKGLKHLPLISFALLPAVCLVFFCWGLKPSNAQEARVNLETRPPLSSSGGADRLASIRINSDLVLIPVLVTDHRDHPITGLQKDHFKLYDDKVEQVISNFTSEDAPVSITLLFDCSGSMGPKLQKSRAAVREFLQTANPEDEFSLIVFADRARMVSDFTDKIEEIQNQLMFAGSKGATALLDAIYLAVNQMKHAKHSRKAILIISDGGDNSSRYTTKEVKNSLREADIQVYSIGILEPFGSRMTPEEMSGPVLLQEIAQETGGRLFEVNDLNELRDIAVRIGAALRNEYVLGYVPTETKHDGKYHRIQVKVERLKGLPPLRATFRSGYYGR
jgi:Ca-activated chloride channel homolog